MFSLLPLVLSSLPQSPPASASALLPIAPLCRAVPEAEDMTWQSMLRYGQDAELFLRLLPEDGGRPDRDTVFAWLHEFEVEMRESGRLYLTGVAEQALAVGATDGIAHLQAVVAAAGAAMARPLQIELCVWPAPTGEAPATRLDASGYARFRADRTPLWRQVATAPAGAIVDLQQIATQRYVRGIAVEVASNSKISRPEMSQFARGMHAQVLAHPLLGGDEFAVMTQFVFAGQRGDLRSAPTGVPGSADLELPVLETCFGACSARIPNGGALAATLRGDAIAGGNFVVTLRVLATAARPFREPDSRLLPCGALATAALRATAPYPTCLDPDRSQLADGGDATGPLIEIDQLIDLVASALAVDESTEHMVQPLGDHLFVRSSAAGLQLAEDLLRQLQDELVQNAELRHVGVVPPRIGGPVEGPPLHELLLPTLVSREAVVARVLETNILGSIEIEIAQEASILCPNVDVFQSGTWLRARVTPAGERRHLQLQGICAVGPVPPMRTVMAGGGSLCTPARETTGFGHDGVLSDDGRVQHGDGPQLTSQGRVGRTELSTSVQ